MTVVGFPLNAVTGSPEYTGEDMRLALSALEFGANVARPLGVRSGVRIGTPTTTASASGFTWTVAEHSGIVDVQTSATAGGYLYAITVAETGAITAANATHPRKDILTIRVDDPQEDATGTPLIAVEYTAGTAAAVPTVPATPTRSMVLARIDTPASGGGDPTVTWLAPVTVAAGGIIPVADNTARDALSTAYGATQTLYATHATDGLITWAKGGAAWVKVGVPTLAFFIGVLGKNVTTATETTLPVTAETSDTFAMATVASNNITIPAGYGGLYSLKATVEFDSNANAARREGNILVNGTTAARFAAAGIATGSFGVESVWPATADVILSAGDVVTVSAYHSAGSTLGVVAFVSVTQLQAL